MFIVRKSKKKLARKLQAIILLKEYFLSNVFRILKMKEENKMKTIEVTQQEINQATRPNVYRNRKKYTRKDKHRNKFIED
jgi:hypothetical protein